MSRPLDAGHPSTLPPEFQRLLDARGSLDPSLSPDRRYILGLRAKMRAANEQAAKASAAWQRREADLRRQHSDPATLHIAKRDDLELADHSDTWSFFQREASRLAAALVAELAAVDLLGEKR